MSHIQNLFIEANIIINMETPALDNDPMPVEKKKFRFGKAIVIFSLIILLIIGALFFVVKRFLFQSNGICPKTITKWSEGLRCHDILGQNNQDYCGLTKTYFEDKLLDDTFNLNGKLIKIESKHILVKCNNAEFLIYYDESTSFIKIENRTIGKLNFNDLLSGDEVGLMIKNLENGALIAKSVSKLED